MKTEIIEQILKIIETEGEFVFFDDNGFLDKSYIMERFSLSNEEYKHLVNELHKVN